MERHAQQAQDQAARSACRTVPSAHRGRLLVIDGVDGSGKATQTQLLWETLAQAGTPVRRISFPDYESPASGPLRMYLNGEFGGDPEAVSAYAASVLFAVDRFASFRKDWQSFYEAGGIVLADRYATSNLIHQAGKLPASERGKFARWLADLEYGVFGLPRPDAVLFLDMPPRHSRALLRARGELKQGLGRDIHEADEAYLTRAYETACAVAAEQGWIRISCAKGDRIRTVEEIHREILARLADIPAFTDALQALKCAPGEAPAR